jgi:arginine repressor
MILSHEAAIRYYTQNNFIKNISSATASRDLKKGVELGLFRKSGTQNITVYEINNR